jgi:hypothetical protein
MRLIALQSIDELGERRRRIVKHGEPFSIPRGTQTRPAGSLDGGARRLQVLARDPDEASGDQRLDGVMAEISLTDGRRNRQVLAALSQIFNRIEGIPRRPRQASVARRQSS